MKNLILFLLFSFSFIAVKSYAQVTPIDERTKKRPLTAAKKMYSEEETKELDALISIYENIGYRCIKTSVEKKINIELLKKAIDYLKSFQ